MFYGFDYQIYLLNAVYHPCPYSPTVYCVQIARFGTWLRELIRPVNRQHMAMTNGYLLRSRGAANYCRIAVSDSTIGFQILLNGRLRSAIGPNFVMYLVNFGADDKQCRRPLYRHCFFPGKLTGHDSVHQGTIQEPLIGRHRNPVQ